MVQSIRQPESKVSSCLFTRSMQCPNMPLPNQAPQNVKNAVPACANAACLLLNHEDHSVSLKCRSDYHVSAMYCPASFFRSQKRWASSFSRLPFSMAT